MRQRRVVAEDGRSPDWRVCTRRGPRETSDPQHISGRAMFRLDWFGDRAYAREIPSCDQERPRAKVTHDEE